MPPPRYLAHKVLGPRLHQCAQLVLDASSATATELLGKTDAKKLQSSMTLFAAIADDASGFVGVLRRFYGGDADADADADAMTLKLFESA